MPLDGGMDEWAPLGFRGAVEAFKRRLIETALRQSGGNRTRAARDLGLQRTYLLRLIRDLRVAAPPPPSRPAARRLLAVAAAGGRDGSPEADPVPAKSVDTCRTPGVK